MAAAIGWSYAGTILRIGVQFGAGIVLARLLGPYAFGLVATSWALVGAGSQFMDLGFSAALIQRRDVTPDDIRFVFTVQVGLGLILAASFALLSSPLAALLGDPALAPVIRLLSTALVAQALGQTALALLKRRLDFKTAQLAQLAGVVIGYLFVAVPLALFTSYAVLSLALGQLAQIAVTAAIAYSRVRHAVRPRFTPTEGLAGFGLKATATNLVNWTIASLDSLAMSRTFGMGDTGTFNRAQNLALAPAGNLVQVLQSVLFPAYSRHAGDAAATRRAYLTSLSAAAAILLPAAAVMAMAPEAIVIALYGPQWISAAALLVPLAVAMPLHAAMALSGPLLWARDRVEMELRIQCAALVFFVVALAIATRFSPLAIAWCVPAVYAVRAVPMVWGAAR
jgi:O-antigen/teichoic acid export membrane protein